MKSAYWQGFQRPLVLSAADQRRNCSSTSTVCALSLNAVVSAGFSSRSHPKSCECSRFASRVQINRASPHSSMSLLTSCCAAMPSFAFRRLFAYFFQNVHKHNKSNGNQWRSRVKVAFFMVKQGKIAIETLSKVDYMALTLKLTGTRGKNERICRIQPG